MYNSSTIVCIAVIASNTTITFQETSMIHIFTPLYYFLLVLYNTQVIYITWKYEINIKSLYDLHEFCDFQGFATWSVLDQRAEDNLSILKFVLESGASGTPWDPSIKEAENKGRFLVKIRLINIKIQTLAQRSNNVKFIFINRRNVSLLTNFNESMRENHSKNRLAWRAFYHYGSKVSSMLIWYLKDFPIRTH